MLKNYCRIYLVLILGAIQTASIAQGTFYFKDDFSQKINFEFINNLIVIPLKVNNKDL